MYDISIRGLGWMHRQILLRQPAFNFKVAIYNMVKLSNHFIEVFRKMHEKMALLKFLPAASDTRCNLIAQHLLMWELHAILAPDRIKIDLFDLICLKGGAIFQRFYMPSGKCSYFQEMKFSRRIIMTEKS